MKMKPASAKKRHIIRVIIFKDLTYITDCCQRIFERLDSLTTHILKPNLQERLMIDAVSLSNFTYFR